LVPTYDAAGRHIQTHAGSTCSGSTCVTIGRDPVDRILTRTTGSTTRRIGYEGYGNGDVLELTRGAGNLWWANHHTIGLPGGVIYTGTAAQLRWPA
jgi:hypothetical protein